MEFFNKATYYFIREHRNDDVRKLAFMGDKYPDVDMPMALDQIAGWQTARQKLPSLAAVDGIIYPPHINMEQCSSEQTARYKASLCSLLTASSSSSVTLIDLTGGFGIDFSFMSRVFPHAIYVEPNERLSEIVEQNLRKIKTKASSGSHEGGGKENTFVAFNATAEDFLNKVLASHSSISAFITDTNNQATPTSHFFFTPPLGKPEEVLREPASVVFFFDPSRRDANGHKVVSLSDCVPNVLELLPQIDKIGTWLMLKLSPMLDWHEAVREINQTSRKEGCALTVKEVHVVSVKNECKELLLVADKTEARPLRIVCVNDSQVFSFTADDKSATLRIASPDEVRTAEYLYEPNASVMKVGGFAAISSKYDVKAVSGNSHLFVSSHSIDDFPGRSFRIMAVSSMNKKELRRNMAGFEKCNIAVRNFPMNVVALRRRLKVTDGGDVYIFGTTLQNASHVLIITKKDV